MNTQKLVSYTFLATILLCAGCAISPEAARQHQELEANIEEILSLPLDPAEFGETRNCLSELEIRTFHVLDNKRIVFEGRNDKLWINTLRSPCPDLRYGTALHVSPFMGTRVCASDRFQAGDWFDWPWYRRWPWHWGTWGTGIPCTLGKFQPVSEAQVAEIEALLESQ